MSTSGINPRGSTFSLENPRRWALTGSRTMRTVLLPTTALITSGLSWGCWQPSMSESEKVMVVSSRGILDTACISSVFPDMMLRR